MNLHFYTHRIVGPKTCQSPQVFEGRFGEGFVRTCFLGRYHAMPVPQSVSERSLMRTGTEHGRVAALPQKR